MSLVQFLGKLGSDFSGFNPLIIFNWAKMNKKSKKSYFDRPGLS